MEIFASIEIMKDHYNIVPPQVGERVYVDGDDVRNGYYVFDGEEWEYEGL